MAKQMFCTGKKDYEDIGIKLTDEQFQDLCNINLLAYDSLEYIPVHTILLVLKTLGLIKTEMPEKENDERTEWEKKFGRTREAKESKWDAKKRRKGLRKSLILSSLIGGMSPYLPFWRFDSASQPVAVAIAMFILSFVVIYPDEIKRIGGKER